MSEKHSLTTGKHLKPQQRGKSLFWIVLRLVTISIALVCSVLLLVTPVNSNQYRYTWEPNTSRDSGVFPLDRSWPSSLDVSVSTSCTSESGNVILSLGGFEIVCLTDNVEVSSGTQKIDLPVGTETDEISVSFNAQSGELTATSETTDSQKTILLEYSDYPRITQLYAPSPLQNNVTVSLVTRPSSIDFDFTRILLFLVVMVCSTASIILLPKSNVGLDNLPLKIKAFWKQGLFVAIGLISSAFAMPMFYDDGWVIQRIKQYLSTGYLGDFYFHSNAWLPQGFITENILALLIQFDFEYLHLRIFVAVLLLLAWIFIVKSAKNISRELSQSSVWISSAIFLSVSAVWCVSLRAEAWVCLFLSIQLYFLSRYFHSKSWVDFYFSGLFLALALATHQSGMLGIVGGIGLVYLAFRDRSKKVFWLNVLISLIAVSTSFLAIFFLGYDFNSILSSVKDFSDGAYENRLNEFARIGELSGSFISSARKFGWMVCLLVFALALFVFHKFDKEPKFFALLLCLYPLGYLFTSSKWGWHLGVISVPIFLMSLLILNINTSNQQLRIKYSVVLPLTSLAIGISLSSVGSWGTYDHRSLSWEDFSHFFAGSQSQYVWYVIAIAFIFFGLYIDNKQSQKLKTLGSCLLVTTLIFPALASMAWIITDSSTPKEPGIISWTMLRQNLKTASGQNDSSCGILGSVDTYVSDVNKLVEVPIVQGSALLTKVKPQLFGWEHVSAWSTQFSNNQLTTTNKYELPAETPANSQPTLWWNRNDSNGVNKDYLIQTNYSSDGTENVVNYELVVPEVGGVWSKLNLLIPPGTEYVSFAAIGNSTDYLTFTEPLMSTISNAKSTLSAGTTFIPPSYLPAVPCAKLPHANEGLFPIPDFIISENYNLDTRMWIEQYFAPSSAMITEIGRVEQKTPSIWRIEFVQPQLVQKEKL